MIFINNKFIFNIVKLLLKICATARKNNNFFT